MEPSILKADGTKQRNDTSVSLAIAVALRERIFRGENVYPPKGESFTFSVVENGAESLIELSEGTIHAWVSRANVIPETGQTLRVYLDQARLEYRNEKEAARRAEIRESAETRLLEIMQIPLKTPPDVLQKFRKKDGALVLTGEDRQSYGAGANPKTLETVLKGVVFGLERLAPEQYSPKSSITSTNLHAFSFVELRRAKEERDAKRAAKDL